MVKVKLLAYSKPIIDGDAKHLPVLAFKVSTGKLHERSPGYYLSKSYPEEKVKRILLSAVEFPSILEHITLTFLVEDISRVCSHQLVRHRLASYTQESQRYSESYMKKVVERIVEAYLNGEIKPHILVQERVENILGNEKVDKPKYTEEELDKIKEKKCKDIIDDLRKLYEEKKYNDIIEWFLRESSPRYLLGRSNRVCHDMYEQHKKLLLEVIEEAFVLPESIKDEDKVCIAEDFLRAIQRYYELLSKGVRYEDARFIIPQAVKTRLMVTLNLRELLHIACLRLNLKAQWEIREVVKQMIEEAKRIIPEIEQLVKRYCKVYGVE